MLRIIVLTALIIVTFVFGFLFAHEPFRNVVIEKTIGVFASDEAPAKRPAAARSEPDGERRARRAGPSARGGSDRPDKLTEKDRRALDTLLEEVEE